jgi:hypothetical protein
LLSLQVFTNSLLQDFCSLKKGVSMKNPVSSLRRNLLIVGGLLVAGLTFTACNKNLDDSSSNPPAAGLMVFNLAPDQATASFSLSGNSFINSLSYSAFTSTYIGIIPGVRSVDAINEMGGSIASTEATFAPNKFYSAFLVGSNNAYRNVVVQDNFDSLGGSATQSFIRYINAVTDSTSSPTVKITAGGSNIVNEPAAFASVSEFKAVPAGSVTIDINNGGLIASNRTITLEGQKVYTVLLIGTPGATTNGVQIKYIENGMLDGSSNQRISSAARTTNIN